MCFPHSAARIENDSWWTAWALFVALADEDVVAERPARDIDDVALRAAELAGVHGPT